MKKNKNGTFVNQKEDTITDFCDPGEQFESQYGLITYKQWCDKEIDRMARGKDGIMVKIIGDIDGKIALAEGN